MSKKLNKVKKLSDNFTIDEFVYSETAQKNKIENIPSFTHLDNIKRLVNEILQPLRDSWENHCKNENLGTPAITISSGYRCALLNKLVGGSKTSVHTIGAAADILPTNGELEQFATFVEDWIDDKEFDQLILEECNSEGVPQWLHIGHINRQGQQRKQIKRT